MTDRELLELAANAAGYRIRVSDGGSFSIDRHGYWVSWNPLRDDGDALRLAVECNLGISIPPTVDCMVDVVTFKGALVSVKERTIDGNVFATTRRAIVRAAAEIGKAMV